MMSGADLIRAERFRQISSENYSPEGDKGRTDELLRASASYALNAADHIVYPYDDLNDTDYYWPWDAKHFKPKSTKRDLVRAGALIAAAIDSLETDD